MLDWSLVLFPVIHDPIASGFVISVDPDGAEEWCSPKRVQATGSFEKSIGIKSNGGNGAGQATELWCNGNPSKFLQGHNVFGSDNVISLLYDVFCILVSNYSLPLQKSKKTVDRFFDEKIFFSYDLMIFTQRVH